MEQKDFIVDRYSHYFSVLPITAMARKAVVDFMTTLIEHQLTKKRGKWSMEPSCVYAAKDYARGRYHLHINCYDEFMLFLENYRITESDLTITQHGLYEPVKVDITVTKEGFVPYETQLPIIDHCLTVGPQAAVTSQPGSGKAQTLSSRIRVPGGWSTMGQMQVGMQVVTRDGSATEVVGVFPQGVTRVYRVTFADGRYTDVNPEHLWQVRLRSNEGEQVLDTEELKRRLYAGNDRARRITVPLIEPEEGIELSYPVHPYLLGVILGDGRVDQYSVQISKPDTELRELIEPHLPEGTLISELVSSEGMTFSIVNEKRKAGRNPINAAMRELGLAEVRSMDKFIPADYLEGSREQRLALLQGLMDTDGTVSKTNVSFSSSSRTLTEAVQYLVRSLGGIARLSTRTPTYTYKGEKFAGLTDYRLSIRHPRPWELFRLTRKRELARPTQYSDTLRLRIDSIVELEPEPTQCIMVAHESHLYVTDDFIVTHNTAMLQFVAARMGVRMAVRSLGGYAGRWAEAWKDYHGWEEKKDFLLCCGAKALRKLIKEMREGKWTELKAIYISNGAVRDLIKDKDTSKHDLECGGMFDVGKLYEELGVGLLGVDEAHKEMHSNFIADLYTNVPVRICLTATLIPRDNFTAKIYEMYLPERLRKDMGALRVYVDVIEVMYNLKHPRKFDRVIKQTVYSHNEFERHLMKDKETLERYMEAFYNYVIRTWLSERVYETKAVFFCGLVDMGAALCAYFKRRLPDIRVAQFNAGDDYDVLDINDLIFTTALKAGTAVDIQDLSRIYNAISIDAPNTLVQIVGRLRYREHLVKEGFHFHQFVCIDIPKQMAYQKNRRQLLRPRVKSIREIPLGALI